MTKLNLILIGLFYVSLVSSQETNFIKSEKIKGRIWNIYSESDSNFYVKIIDKKGRLNEIRRYKDLNFTIENGEWIEYYNQSIIKKRYFNNGFPDNVWEYYNSNGKLLKTLDYKFPLIFFQKITQDQNNDIKDSTKYIIVDELPKFNGGDINEFRSYIQKKIIIEEYMLEKYDRTGINKIYVQFIIDRDGNVAEIKAFDEGRKFLEKDAVRLVKESPKWTPGYLNDLPVKVQITFPIVYIFP